MKRFTQMPSGSRADFRRFCNFSQLVFTGLALCFVTGSFRVSTALAAPVGPVVSTLTAMKVVSKDGDESLVAADKVAPGEIIEYRAQYRNTGKRAVREVQATLPIPRQLQLVSGSLLPSGAKASVDGKTFGPMPLRRRVKAADGSTQVVAVPLSQIRFLRWTIGTLDAGQSIAVKARARVNN